MRPPYLVGSATFATRLPPPDPNAPIDWGADPHRSRSWRFEVHTLSWLPAESDPGQAVRVALDWIEHNPPSAPATDVAWLDMSVARRGPRLAELAELAERAEDAAALHRAAAEHAEWLAVEENYSGRGNHGLFQSEGLLLLAAALPDHPAAERWRELAHERLDALLELTVDAASGVHLEHSPAYQMVVINLVARMGALTDRFDARLARMRDAAGWMVTPGGTLAQIGDSHATTVGFVRARQFGVRDGVMRLPGYVAVRAGDSYLLVACALHSLAHAQDDDGTFVWWHEGREIVCDTGAYAYDSDHPRRQHALSPAAHSTLEVGGLAMRRSPRARYGDGIRDVVTTPEETTITVGHRRYAGVKYTRVLRLRPGGVLVVEDHVASRRARRYIRRVHLREEGAAEVRSDADEHTVIDDWTAPRFRETQPTRTHVLVNRGRSMALRLELRARAG